MNNKESKTIEFNRIEIEREKLNSFFQGLSEKKREIADGLIQNASFMKITLLDLQERIQEDGPIETYQNGANQYGQKISSSLNAYNQTIKNYTNVIRKLIEMLPEGEESGQKEDKLEKFLAEFQ